MLLATGPVSSLPLLVAQPVRRDWRRLAPKPQVARDLNR
jgi:hypothetical protein